MVRLALIVLIAFSLVATGVAWSAEQGLVDMIVAFVKKGRPSAEVKVEGVSHTHHVPVASLKDVVVTAGSIPGRATFSFSFADGSKINTTAIVRLSERVVMPKRAFNKGYILTEDDVYEAFMDVMRIPRNAVSDISDVINRRLARSIVPNAPITMDMVSEAAVLKSGTSVTLVCEGQGFSIRTTGELRQRGLVGEYVKVMNRSSKKILTGLLLDKATVKVEL